MGLPRCPAPRSADARALGGTLVPALSKAYGKGFASGDGGGGFLSRPHHSASGAMIVYAILAGREVSVGGMFIAGMVPG